MSLLGFSVVLTVLVVLFNFTAADDNLETVTVETMMGPIKGLKEKDTDSSATLYSFRGIQYGKAPIRFDKPEPVPKWTETMDATEFGPSCIQYVPDEFSALRPAKMSEECLFLNIYVPRSLKPGKELSVMVWIHGGGLLNGNGDIYNAAWLAMQGDVIVVTINYRLGIFGFLALDHPASRGNYGLWDQKLALQWVHDNIESFGGNPNSVTIFGESAGGWSVSFQSLIPSNQGLFQRVIAQSGVVSRGGVLNKKVIKDGIKQISKITECPDNDMYELIDCLRSKSSDVLINETNYYALLLEDKVEMNFIFQPSVDGELYSDHPVKLLEKGDSNLVNFFGSLDFMAGTTSNEGNLLPMMILPSMQEKFRFNLTEGVPSNFLCNAMIYPYVEKNLNDDSSIAEALCEFYKSDGTIGEQGLKTSDCYADLSFVYPTMKMLEYHASVGGGRTYQYQLSVESEKPINVAGPPPKWFKGTGHAEDLHYMFNLKNIFPEADIDLTSGEKELSRQIIQYWTSFAKSGNPGDGKGSVMWKQFDVTERSYIDLNIPSTMKKFLRADMVNFLSDIFPPLSNDKSFKDEL